MPVAAADAPPESPETSRARRCCSICWSASCERHEPEVAAVLREERTTAGMPAALLARTLQAQGIWFQLLAIAEQNRDMRSRRETRARARLRTAARHLRQRCSHPPPPRASPPARSGRLCRDCASGPVITAHPTEAKRVTVLERHRRIYLRLLDLEVATLDRARARRS